LATPLPSPWSSNRREYRNRLWLNTEKMTGLWGLRPDLKREAAQLAGPLLSAEEIPRSGRWAPQTRASALLAFDAAGEIQRASDVEDHAITHLEANIAQPPPRSLDCEPRGDAAVVYP
jgi:hypothetical protein